MKLVMTLLVRDEGDIVREHLDYHLNAGVDLVIATDHRSEDGTREILESYEQRGVVRLFRRDDQFTRENEWLSQMARLAAREHAADWIINSAADEFWFPRGASLKDTLSEVPAEFGVARGLLRNFVPMRADGGSFVDRMTFRLAGWAPINDPGTPFRPAVKTAHRAHESVWVTGGHAVSGLDKGLLDSWHPFEVLHFPLRSRAQCAAKYRRTWTGWAENLRGDLARARRAASLGRVDPTWEHVAIDEERLERGLATGSLVRDTRLRDAVASSRRRRAPPTVLPRSAELDAHALDTAVFLEAEVVRLQRWLDEVQRRVLLVEQRP
jgi:hypothetical protein